MNSTDPTPLGDQAGRRDPAGATTRSAVEQRLVRRYPDIPPGVVLAAVGAALRLRARPARSDAFDWYEVEAAAEESLLLRLALGGTLLAELAGKGETPTTSG